MRNTSITDREEGAVAITTALILVVLILLAAFLVDLGGTRADARTDQLLADSALLAGAAVDGDARDQCRVVIEYFAANIGAGTGYPDHCDDLPASCDPSLPTPDTPTTPMEIGPYTVIVWHPVSNDDAAMKIEGQGITDRDGDLCDRMKIEVRRDRDFTFGAAGGGANAGSSVNDAVARRRIVVGEKEFATLIVLDREGCAPLQARGGSQALVEDHAAHPGMISVDSPGTLCSGGGSGAYVMTTEGGNARICAGVDSADVPAIQGGAPCTDPADGEPRITTPAVTNGREVYEPDWTSGRVRPRPVFERAVTRAPADHTWNCLETYPEPRSEWWEPTDRIEGCEEGHDPYIEEMASRLADSGDSGFTAFGPWNTTHSGGTCDLTGPTVGSSTENIYLNCDTVRISAGESVEILAKDYIVVRGNLDVRGRLTVDTGDDVVMVFQDGGLRTPGSPEQVSLTNTGVYVHQTTFSGADNAINVNLSGTCLVPSGDPPPCTSYPVEWTAPAGPPYDIDADGDGVPEILGECETLTPENLPSPECFDKMALWSNADDNHILKGLMDVEGVFFTPNAGRENNTNFELSGGATQPMRQAQFFAYRLFITGGSSVLMRPDPESILPTHELVASLIR